MINVKVWLLFMTLLFSLQGSAQKVGKVLQFNSQTPVLGVNIYLSGNRGIAVTDTLGQFQTVSLSRLAKTDTLFFSCVGYEREALTLSELRERHYVVYLQEVAVAIGEVAVTAKPLRNFLQYEWVTSMPDNGVYSFASVMADSCIFITGGDYTNIKMGALPTDPKQLTKLHNLIFEGYSKKTYRYDIAKNHWERVRLNFEPRAYHTACRYGKRIYVLGGKRLSQNKKLEYLDEKIEIYDWERNKVVTDYVNPHQAINSAAFVYQNDLIVMGGSVKKVSDDLREYTKKVHLLNLNTGYWYELNDMPMGKEVKGVVEGESIYLFGGYRNKPLDEVDSYNLRTGEWKRIGTLRFAVSRPGVVCVGKMAYIFENKLIQVYDLENNTCKAYQIGLQLTGSELFYRNRQLYLLGGCRLEGYDTREINPNVYSIDLAAFDETSSF